MRGEVRDERGARRPDVMVGLEGDGWASAVTVEDGRFLLAHLPAGRYTLAVWPSGFGRPAPESVLARRTITVTRGNVTGLVIVVPRR